MQKMIKRLLGIICILSAMQSAWADDFVVKQIKIIGLQRVKESTALSYMPIHIGQI